MDQRTSINRRDPGGDGAVSSLRNMLDMLEKLDSGVGSIEYRTKPLHFRDPEDPPSQTWASRRAYEQWSGSTENVSEHFTPGFTSCNVVERDRHTTNASNLSRAVSNSPTPDRLVDELTKLGAAS